jgi:hypothetical protein
MHDTITSLSLKLVVQAVPQCVGTLVGRDAPLMPYTLTDDFNS